MQGFVDTTYLDKVGCEAADSLWQDVNEVLA